MKSIYKYFSVIFILLFITSCNRKLSHEQALNYYVNVSMQIREVTILVKSFTAKLSLLKQDSSSKIKTLQNYESLKSDYYELVGELDKKTKILDELAYKKENFYLKHSAINFIKDTRDILVNDVFRLLNIYKPAADKIVKPGLTEMYHFFVRKDFLITDDRVFKQLSKIYIQQYHLTNGELVKYKL